MHMNRGNDSLHFFYDAQGKPAEVIFNGNAYRYLYNLQGDVVALVDGSGTKVVEYSYDAWGKPIGKMGSLAETLGTVQPFRYRGYVWDEETGLYYLRSRYYRPEWGRFVNADSRISVTSRCTQIDLFTYCANEPVSFYDPSGHSIEDFLLDLLDEWVYHDQRGFWASVCVALNCAGMKYSAYLLGNSINRKPKPLAFDCNSELSKIISQDIDFLRELREAVNAGNKEFDVSFELNRDLFGAIHDAHFTILSLERSDNCIAYRVELSDRYDFTEFETDYLQKGIFNAIAWIGNDLAYLDMMSGALNDYLLTIEIEGVLP